MRRRSPHQARFSPKRPAPSRKTTKLAAPTAIPDEASRTKRENHRGPPHQRLFPTISPPPRKHRRAKHPRQCWKSACRGRVCRNRACRGYEYPLQAIFQQICPLQTDSWQSYPRQALTRPTDAREAHSQQRAAKLDDSRHTRSCGRRHRLLLRRRLLRHRRRRDRSRDSDGHSSRVPQDPLRCWA